MLSNIIYFFAIIPSTGVLVCRRKDKSIASVEEDCAALNREVKKGREVIASLLLVVRTIFSV